MADHDSLHTAVDKRLINIEKLLYLGITELRIASVDETRNIRILAGTVFYISVSKIMLCAYDKSAVDKSL